MKENRGKVMKKFKKQFLAATLVLALGAAVYLNWSLSAKKPVTRTLGESKLVNATISTEATSGATEPKADSLSDKQKKFFANAKNQRSTTQDKIIDTASKVLKLDSTSDEEKSEAQAQVAGVIKFFTMQDDIETTLRAKGFSDCLCFLNENGCTVTVLKKELNDRSNLSLRATVKSVANVDFEKITIVTV